MGAAAIVHDTVNTMIQALSDSRETRGMGEFVRDMEPEEQYCLIRELLEPEFGSLYVTPPDGKAAGGYDFPGDSRSIFSVCFFRSTLL